MSLKCERTGSFWLVVPKAKHFVSNHNLIMDANVKFVFYTSKTNKGKIKTYHCTMYVKKQPPYLNISHSMVALIRRNLWLQPQSYWEWAANGLLSMGLCRSSRVTHAPQAGHNVRGHVQEQGVAGQGWGSRGGPSVLSVWVCVLLSRQCWLCTAKKAVPWQGLMAGWCSLLWLVHSFQVKLGKWHCVKIPSRMNVLLP